MVDDSRSLVVVIRYEEMHAQPGTAFRESVGALDLELEPAARLSKAVALSEFETIREQEQQNRIQGETHAGGCPLLPPGQGGRLAR